jgi:hypothetical protein
MELLNVPQYHMVQSGYYQILCTKCELKIGLENDVLLPHVDFRVPESVLAIPSQMNSQTHP